MPPEPQHSRIAEIMTRPWEFLAVFLVLFFLASVGLYAVDFVPEPVTLDPTDSFAAAAAPEPVLTQYPVEQPVRVTIKAIGVDTPVENPTTADVTALDAELLKGAVRYPSSAKLGETGTVYLFGHQSYLPVVHNQAFKAFNNVQKLKEGDIITVSSATADYTYQVSSVTLTDVADGIVPLQSNGRTLILSTCNSLSSDHEQRYIVTATFLTRTEKSKS